VVNIVFKVAYIVPLKNFKNIIVFVLVLHTYDRLFSFVHGKRGKSGAEEKLSLGKKRA